METVFETNFPVMPIDANYMYPLIFGGAFFAKMDLCAAMTVNRFLHSSPTCGAAVTHKAEVTWVKPCYVGDLIFLRGEVVETGKKSVVVKVTAHRERRGTHGGKYSILPVERDHVGDATFVFVSIVSGENVTERPDLLPYAHHGLNMHEDPVS